jgi:hypothetical protein
MTYRAYVQDFSPEMIECELQGISALFDISNSKRTHEMKFNIISTF